uniref:Secologanin synthase n=1 Tax=Cajanus cajan TaxID=3821 RepID=A0A151RBL4_CAJCA|nr:Secologanin synthase [Cajanus cajan]
MEDYIFKALTISFAFIVLYVTTKLLQNFWWRPKRIEKLLRQQGIRGTSYKFFKGDMPEMMKSIIETSSKPMSLNHHIVPHVIPFLHQMFQKYGKISLFWFGRTPSVLIGDAELVRFILTNKNGHFIKPPQNPLVKHLQLGLSSLEGEIWSKRRRLIASAFLVEKLKGMVPAISRSCCMLIERWQELAKDERSCEFDVLPELSVLSGDVIARTAFGSSYQEGKKVFELQHEQISLVREAYWGTYIPGFRFIPTKKNKRRYQMYNQINAILKEMIKRREQRMKTGELESHDLLSLLLECKGESESSLTVDDVIEECKLLYFAGQETTTNLLTWTMIVLSMHSNWQEKARAEVFQICGKNVPGLETINRLKIVTMVLHEVLRLYPPISYIQRYTLFQLELPFMLLHHDPRYWDNPQEFNPERFSQGVSKASHDQVAFYPFSWGPRICLGQNFSLIEAKIALAMILQHFSFQLSPSYAHAPRNSLTLKPQHGAPIIIHSI